MLVSHLGIEWKTEEMRNSVKVGHLFEERNTFFMLGVLEHSRHENGRKLYLSYIYVLSVIACNYVSNSRILLSSCIPIYTPG